MGHILDLVPNHMGIAKSANPWWLDVLENGPSSRFARFFDIEWHPVKDELADKVLIPILGDQYGAVLERQELQLAYRDGAFVVRYYDDTLPVAPDTYGVILAARARRLARRTHARRRRRRAAEHPDRQRAPAVAQHARSGADRGARARKGDRQAPARARSPIAAPTSRRSSTTAFARFNGSPGQPRSFDALDALLNAQSYRLAHWRVASEEINYRRFFDVNELAALRMEDPAVFDEVHRFVFELVRAARSPACASITSTACSRRATTSGGCRSAAAASARRRAVLHRRREDPRRRTKSCRRLAGARHDRLRVRAPS